MRKATRCWLEAGLGQFGNKYPGEVSSGMAPASRDRAGAHQTTEGASADEPYRAMDALTKSIMHEALLEMYDRTKVTIFFITHDLEEAIFLGDRVYVLTTRPCRLKKVVEVKIPRPRNYESPDLRAVPIAGRGETKDAVHEEAIKAFPIGRESWPEARRVQWWPLPAEPLDNDRRASRRSLLRKALGSSEFWRGVVAIVVFLCLVGDRRAHPSNGSVMRFPISALLPAPTEVAALAWSRC